MIHACIQKRLAPTASTCIDDRAIKKHCQQLFVSQDDEDAAEIEDGEMEAAEAVCAEYMLEEQCKVLKADPMPVSEWGDFCAIANPNYFEGLSLSSEEIDRIGGFDPCQPLEKAPNDANEYLTHINLQDFIDFLQLPNDELKER